MTSQAAQGLGDVFKPNHMLTSGCGWFRLVFIVLMTARNRTWLMVNKRLGFEVAPQLRFGLAHQLCTCKSASGSRMT